MARAIVGLEFARQLDRWLVRQCWARMNIVGVGFQLLGICLGRNKGLGIDDDMESPVIEPGFVLVQRGA